MIEDRAISLNAVIKAVDQHTNDDGTLDDDISCILEDLPPVTLNDEEMAMQYTRGYIDGFKEVKATFEPKTGHWTDTDDGFSPCECSECKSVEFIKSKFCPNCGARMYEPQERSDKE